MGYNLTKRNPLYELIADYTVTGSAITSYTFSNLNLIKDEDYVLVSDVVSPSGLSYPYDLTINGNNTRTNYYYQRLYADSTTVGGARENYPKFMDVNANSKALTITQIKLTNSGYFTSQSKSLNLYGGSSAYLNTYYTSSTFTASSITSLTITGQVSNIIGVNSRFQLYRIRPASKIADVTIGSAVTSYTFDLSATPIGKGSEFMLVSDFNVVDSNLNVYANNNLTDTNYYAQRILASSTSVVSARGNAPTVNATDASSKYASFVNIKLTNNGYFVYQSNGVRTYGGSSIQVENWYGTSTFTSNSITQIMLKSVNANGLGIGTRFQLYRLK